MYFVVSGEGASDLGVKCNGEFEKGPLARLIEIIVENAGGTTPELNLICESELNELCKKSNPKNYIAKGVQRGLVFDFYCKALTLALHVGDELIGIVYFRDSDGTNSSPRDLWRSLEKAMETGFIDGGSKYGVPMLPRPKSEAWLMGYYQKFEQHQCEYNSCERFEEEPGNDNSPNSLKKRLAAALGCSVNGIYTHITYESMSDITWSRIDMPSFNIFRKRLENVACMLSRRSLLHPSSETSLL